MALKYLLKWILILPALIIAFALSSCREPVTPEFTVLPPMIGPEGGIVEGLDGDVVMAVPAGALSEHIRFSMHELLLKSANDEKELLKTFVIEPSVTFNIPVKLTVNWNGCLSNGSSLCDNMDVFFHTWSGLSSYCLNSGGCITTCCLDMTSETVSSCIPGTGVIATIGITR